MPPRSQLRQNYAWRLRNSGTVRTLVKIDGIEDEVRRLAAEFERHLGHGLKLATLGMCKEAGTFFKLLLAAASMTFRPVIVEPVKATLSTPGCAASAAPPMLPREGTQLRTPGGNLQAGERRV